MSFIGRQTELDHLYRLLEDADGGRPGLVLIEGPPGIGKTALVRRFLEMAEEPRTVWASGEESERSLSLGLISQLASQAPLAPPLAAVLRPEGHPVDPLATGAALVEMLGEMQHTGAVVLIVDDAQWADHPSLQALTFALRRLRIDRVLTLVLVRDLADPHLPDGLCRLLTNDQTQRLTLGGLAPAELRDLSGQLGFRRLSLSAAERLRAHTDGNPLHARALLEQLPASAFEAPEAALPAPHSFAMVVLARLASCAEEVQGLVLAASVLGAHCTLDQVAILAQVSEPLPAVEQAIRAGLLVEEQGAGTIRFPHPLVQAALYQQLGPARRAALHTRAAGMSQDEVTGLRHRVRAASGLDLQLAAEVAELGRRAEARGDWSAAGEQLSTAARLTPAGAAREQLTLEAVDCQLLTGDMPDAGALSAQLRSFSASGWRSYILAHAAFVTGQTEEVEGLLHDAWHRCDPTRQAGLAARIAGLMACVYILQGDGRRGAGWASQALQLAPGPFAGDILRCLRLLGLGSSGQAEGALASLDPLPAPALATLAELDALLGRGILRLWTDDLMGARQDLSGALTAGYDRSAVFRITAADLLANTEYRLGRWDDALAHSEFALSMAEDAEQTWAAPLCRATAAMLAAVRGRLEEASLHAETAQRTIGPGWFLPMAHAATAAAQVARARGQPEAVIEALRPLVLFSDRDGVAEPGVEGWQDLLSDALVTVGEHGQAEEVLRPFEVLAAQRGRHFALAAAARARGNLEAARDNPEVADAAFQAGLRHAGQTPAPFAQARLHLAYGAFLRRSGKRSLAAEHLGAARTTLVQLDARPDLELCDRELAACGLTPQPHVTTQTDLTPQELAVARLVASGLTNQQVARELVVSVKTVEYHLSHVYAKVGVTSRVYLGSRLGEN
jgi:DNA-binding NarL/FixJ family response regulator